MTKKKSTPRKKGFFWTFVFTVLTAISGGGIGGYFNPNIPVVGPLIKNLLSSFAADAAGIGTGIGESLPGVPGGIQFPGSTVAAGGGVPVQLAAARRPADKILIATFNIQVFGESKIAKTRCHVRHCPDHSSIRHCGGSGNQNPERQSPAAFDGHAQR